MALCSTPGRNELAGDLNRSERARQRLAPAVARLLGHDEKIGYQVESIFTTFWQLARKADDMMDYSASSDLKWLQVLQHLFQMCSSAQSLPSFIPAEAWLKTAGHFFHLMSMTCKGEVEDLLLASRPASESHYNRMALLKTGPWFTGRIACAALAMGREIGKDLLEYGDLACLAYQIRNDIRDAEAEGKDIAIGKLNYPALLLRQNPARSCGRAVELAARAADSYEERSMKIASKYGGELELLVAQLCSPD
ncbi:MAG TPA: polyprenyl synthetase family protein [Nitrososphaera sp.]|nr:polyprenyl synthetase family protein [Nitrososphaera sp.]